MKNSLDTSTSHERLRLAKNSVGTFFSKSLIFLILFATGLVIARVLGPEGKGLFHFLITAVLMCRLLGNFGIGPASIYFIGQDRKCLPALVGNLFVFASVVGVIFVIAGWIFLQHSQSDMIAQLPLWMCTMAALLVPLYILRGVLMQILSALLRIKEINLIQVTAAIVRFLLTILFIIMLQGGVGGAFLAYAISDGVAVGGYFLMVVRYGGRPARPDLALLGASLRFGIKSYLANAMRDLNLRLDVLLLATLAARSMHAIGIYSVATNLAELMIFIPESIRLTLFPMVASGSKTEANRLTQASCRHTMFLTFICALASMGLGPLVIPHLYGERFAGAITPLLILLPGVVMLSQAHVLYGYFMGQGKPGITTISTLFSLVVTIILDLVLIPRYGVIGAAVASTCAYTTEFLTSGVCFTYYSGTLWRESLVFRKSDLKYYSRTFKSLANALHRG